jgi:hypothetical protein
MYRTPRGYALVGPYYTNPCAAGDGTYEYAGLTAGEYLVGLLLGEKPVNPSTPYDAQEARVTLADGQQLTGIDFGFVPRSPNPGPVVPFTTGNGPSATAFDAPLSAPSAGSGGPSGGDRVSSGALALALTGALALAFAAHRQVRRR